jgi:hypothetical protein
MLGKELSQPHEEADSFGEACPVSSWICVNLSQKSEALKRVEHIVWRRCEVACLVEDILDHGDNLFAGKGAIDDAPRQRGQLEVFEPGQQFKLAAC